MSRRSADILVRQFIARRLADKNVRAPALAAHNRFSMLLSIGDQVKPGSYRLHSTFRRAVNYEHRGRLISVVDEAIGPGPLNIVLRSLADGGRARLSSARRGLPQTTGRRAEDSRALPAGLPLRVIAHTVLFAAHRYHFTSRQRYHSTIELKAVDLHRLQHNLSALGESLKETAPPKSLAFLLDGKRRKNFRAGFERAFAEQITRGVYQVFQGRLLPGIRQLKGCGLGLTPAGDDFIAGFLIALHLLQRLDGQDCQSTADAVFRAAQGDNIFSNTFLDLARQGLLFGRMKDLLLALVAGSEGSVRRAARKLFDIGETSGADLATGLFMTLQFEQNTLPPSVPRPSRSGDTSGIVPARGSARIRALAYPAFQGAELEFDSSDYPQEAVEEG